MTVVAVENVSKRFDLGNGVSVLAVDNIPQSELGIEGDSWQRAIRYLSGEKDVFGYRR